VEESIYIPMNRDRNCFPGNGKVTEHAEEIRQLERELELVKEERDILKKAVVIFSEPKR